MCCYVRKVHVCLASNCNAIHIRRDENETPVFNSRSVPSVREFSLKRRVRAAKRGVGFENVAKIRELERT
jgi:hypothetical protein